jgi:hypothetical protein
MKCPKCGFNLNYNRDFQDKIREHYPNAFLPWLPIETEKLQVLVQQGASLSELSKALGRQESAIQRRLEILQLTIKPRPKNPELEAYERAVKALEEAEPEPSPASLTEPVAVR